MKRRHGFHWPVALAAVTFAIAPVAVGGGSSERGAHHDRFFDRVTRFFSRFRFFRPDYPYYFERYERHPDFGGNSDVFPYYLGPDSTDPIDLAVEVQTELARRGYYNGPIDGVIGPGSQMAIREFQTAAGLSATGQIDDNLVSTLRATELGAPAEDSYVEPPPEDSDSSVEPAPPENSFVAPLPSPAPTAVPKQDSSPMASWVKGKEGQQVLSPFTGGVVDVSGFPPGAEVRCPYSGKIFVVPTKP